MSPKHQILGCLLFLIVFMWAATPLFYLAGWKFPNSRPSIAKILSLYTCAFYVIIGYYIFLTLYL